MWVVEHRQKANAWMRAHRPPQRDMTPLQRLKANCRAYTKMLQARRTVQKGPCEGCGNEEAQNHHPDYTNPRWFFRLCITCHRYAG